MKEEGFVNGAYNLIKKKNLSARWQANQNFFNGLDDRPIDNVAKASVIVAIDIYNTEVLPNELDEFIEKADKASTQGEIRQIIKDVNELLSKK